MTQGGVATEMEENRAEMHVVALHGSITGQAQVAAGDAVKNAQRLTEIAKTLREVWTETTHHNVRCYPIQCRSDLMKFLVQLKERQDMLHELCLDMEHLAREISHVRESGVD